MAGVLCGDIALYSSQFPSFLYPHDTVYDEEDAGHGLFRGEYFLKVSLYRDLIPILIIRSRSFVQSIQEVLLQLIVSDVPQNHQKLSSMECKESPEVPLHMLLFRYRDVSHI
jgi:hypothetical protein